MRTMSAGALKIMAVQDRAQCTSGSTKLNLEWACALLTHRQSKRGRPCSCPLLAQPADAQGNR